jgi:protein-disulfide isomerase
MNNRNTPGLSGPLSGAGILAILGTLGMPGAGLSCAARTTPPTRVSASPAAVSSAPTSPAPTLVAVPASETAAGDGLGRIQVPLLGAARGPETAKVTVVEFSDFQCPFCSRVLPTLEQLQKEYPSQVRIFFRHFPLPFHPNAAPAAEAAVAAEAQGKFWEMHDKLFANQKDLSAPSLEAYAQQIGLDLPKFRAALQSHAGKARVNTDAELGRQIGVEGTPTLFLNGRLVAGAQPIEEFRRVVDDEIARADKLLARGVPPNQLYATLLEGALSTSPSPAPRLIDASPEVYKIPLDGAPARGGVHPKVTIVEFSDFQCPYCGRVETTLQELLKDYGNDVAIVYRHNPLPFHANAMAAALACEAARAQGRFWEMHDKLYANQQTLGPDNLQAFAQGLGLNMAAFKAALASERDRDRIQADMDLAVRFGARGTPTFFINGRTFLGAQPIEGFKKVIDEEIKKADAELAAGTPRARLYAALTKDGLDKKDLPKPGRDPNAPDPDTRYRADIKGAPVRGGRDALVTIVEWGDFQCPFSERAETTLAELMATYGDDLRLVWRDQPLPFHANAEPAAMAARAAATQGKFWAMHDRLYAHQSQLDLESLERYAGELGLNVARFKDALTSKSLQVAVQADAAAGKRIGATGTPAFFINGKFLSGAQPIEAFEKAIDAELKEAKTRLAHGSPRTHLYEVMMKEAKAELQPTSEMHPPSAPKAIPSEGPPTDARVYEIDANRGPSKGPQDAPLQVVIFSDFQCPFCARLEPALAQLEKAYRDQVRMVWKNYPLPFHANARPAAEAALAALAQGKFWEMHDKLFADQQHLDRPTYEKYAGELGLDLARFRADLDAQKYEDWIDADRKDAEAAGVTGTPSVFINGRKIVGAYPFETFKQIADDELAKKKGAHGKRE